MAHATNTSEDTLRGLVLVMALAALLFPVAAWADTVVLDDGVLTLLVSNPVAGGRDPGKTLEASGPDFSIKLLSGALSGPTCLVSCLPGRLFRPNITTAETTQGTVTYAGVTYFVVGPDTVHYEVIGDPILFPPLAATFSATTPFSIRIDTSLDSCHRPPFPFPCFDPNPKHVTAIGQGVATFSFVPLPPVQLPEPIEWALASGVYEIQTPEPGTWLLVPTAVGLAWLAHKKRRATSDPEEN